MRAMISPIIGSRPKRRAERRSAPPPSPSPLQPCDADPDTNMRDKLSILGRFLGLMGAFRSPTPVCFEAKKMLAPLFSIDVSVCSV
jgi:hypothetical protein